MREDVIGDGGTDVFAGTMTGVREAGSGVRVAVCVGCGVIVGDADSNGAGVIEGRAVLTCPEG